jgi:hypothetical protein
MTNNPSSFQQSKEPPSTSTINATNNNVTGDGITKSKSNDNIKRTSEDVKFGHQIMKLNDNLINSTLKLKNSVIEEEEKRELAQIKKNFETLVKLNILDENLTFEIVSFLMSFMINKNSLEINILTDLMKKLKLTATISQGHFKYGKSYL